MYVWQWEIGPTVCVMGRTWEEFRAFVDRLIFELHRLNAHLCVYVHSLAYEFQFISGIYPFRTEDVFATDPRKVLCADLEDALEFRCSYFLANLSLHDFTHEMRVEHVKQSGEEFDYSKRRFPWTELTAREKLYCVNDVRGLVEAIAALLAIEGDTVATVPKTSTGFVRRDVRNAMKNYSFSLMRKIQPDEHVYRLLREAFRGGSVHCNRYYAGSIVPNVTTYDRSSSYPDVMLNHEFPMSPFRRTGPMTPEQLDTWINVRKKAVLIRCTFSDIKLSNIYLRREKCYNIDGGVYDNGAILSADYLETVITDVDLRIIADEYDFSDMCVVDGAVSTYGKLPEPIREVIRSYYKAKTALKGIEGEIDGVEALVLYAKAKRRLNAIVGLAATNPAKDHIKYIDGDYFLAGEQIADLLEKNARFPAVSYYWAPYICAWARYELELGIKCAGSDNVVYIDTDSVKFTGDADFDELNAEKMLASSISGAHAVDANGETHYMGVWEYDGHADRWTGLGSKKYCAEEGGKLKLTLAGVRKKQGAKFLEEHGGIESFRYGFVFEGEEVAGVEAVYNDKPSYGKITIDGHELEVTKNVYLQPSKYELTATGEYSALLEKCAEIFADRKRNHDIY